MELEVGMGPAAARSCGPGATTKASRALSKQICPSFCWEMGTHGLVLHGLALHGNNMDHDQVSQIIQNSRTPRASYG